MAVSRSYATGRNKTITATATISLKRCGGRYIRTPEGEEFGSPPVDSGWRGSDFFHLFEWQNVATYDNKGTSISLSAFNGAVAVNITTMLWDARTDDPPTGDDFVWRTEITHNGTVVQRWDEQREIGVTANAPETVTVSWVGTVTVEEWFYEIDSQSDPSQRPGSAYDPTFIYGLKATGDIISTAYGSSKAILVADAFGTDSVTGDILIDTQAKLSIGITGKPQGIEGTFLGYRSSTGWVPGSFTLETLPEANGMGDILVDTVYADVNNVSEEGTLPYWTSSLTDNTTSSDPCALTDELGGYFKLRRFINLTSHDFIQHLNETAEGITGIPSYDLMIDGRIRDWNGPIYNIPVQFTVMQLPCFYSKPLSLPFTAVQKIEGQPVPYVLPPAGYQTDDNHSALFRIGAEWNALAIDHKTTLAVEDFSRIGGTNGWTGTDCLSGPSYSGGKLTVTGDSGSPRIDKVLKNDFIDIWQDSALNTWWTANGGNLTALTSAEQTAANIWWNESGVLSSTPHLGDWYRIGRKLLAMSDFFNWSSYRYADLKGYADSNCNITLRITYYKFTFSGTSADTITATPGPVQTVDFDVLLTTVSANHRIDFASKCGHDSLRYIVGLRFIFPTGNTINLESLTLTEVERPVIDVHQPSDMAYLSALSDGKHSLFLTPRSDTVPGSRWGWPVFEWRDGKWSSLLQDRLVRELNLQEGWTAALKNAPDNGSPNYSVWLREAFEQKCPATLKGQRCFLSGAIYPNFGQTLIMEANLGNALPTLVFDPDTFLPVRVPIEADDSGAIKQDGSITDVKGYGRLEAHKEDDFTIYASKGTPNESSVATPTISRMWDVIELTGKEVAGTASNPALVIDLIGNQWVVFVPSTGDNANKITLARKLGADADWTYIPVIPGDSPWIEVNESAVENELIVPFVNSAGNILQVKNTRNGEEGAWTNLKIITTGASNPTIRKDKATGVTYYLFWKDVDGGTIFLLRSDDEGSTFKESQIAVITGISEGFATLDINQENHLEVVYENAGEIVSKISTDNGLTWT